MQRRGVVGVVAHIKVEYESHVDRVEEDPMRGRLLHLHHVALDFVDNPSVFEMSYAGRNGTVYGQGIYCALTNIYTSQYSLKKGTGIIGLLLRTKNPNCNGQYQFLNNGDGGMVVRNPNLILPLAVVMAD